ncbi:hypothetical protein BHE74_00047255 [Ensete ventricosum]|nr:hypothetical protein GW17_00042266 [Ensete ventricosum]RWW46800.1 hypothetical protein BHE74_00047255 [Ensete ventricosum]
MLDSKGFKNGSLTQFILLPWKHSCIKCLNNEVVPGVLSSTCNLLFPARNLFDCLSHELVQNTSSFISFSEMLVLFALLADPFYPLSSGAATDQSANDLNSCKNVRENDSPAPD